MKNKRLLVRGAVILVIAVVAYANRARFPGEGGEKSPSVHALALRGDLDEALGESVAKTGPYDTLTACRLVPHDNNDGDSFFVRHDAGEFELRLYFVDAPEKYLSDRHESQRRRVAEQAAEFGIDPEEAVAVGKAAKEFTRRTLQGKEFTVHTYWEQVYSGDRYYGFVEMPAEEGFLGDVLVANGLARIHTKGPGSKENPVDTPEGLTFHQHRDRLYRIEKGAQRADAGAWGLRN